MNNNYYEQQMQELDERRSSGKARMIIGIALFASSIIFYIVGVAARAVFGRGIPIALLFLIIFLPLAGAGIPLFVTGLVGMNKANNRIELLKRQMYGPVQQPPYQPYQQQYPPYQQPYRQPYQQPYQPQYQQPYQQPYPPQNQQPYPPQNQQPVYQQPPQPQENIPQEDVSQNTDENIH